MMAASTFDALKAARELEAAGVTRQQAEAHAAALRDAATADHDELVTRTDLNAAIGTVRSEIGTVHSEVGTVHSEVGTVHSEIRAVRSELATVRWVLGITAASTIATFAIVAAKLL